MQDQQTTTLTTVLSEVLANLAFMFTDDAEFEPPFGERWLETSIGYKGSVSGSLLLTCTGTFAAQLAANLLGVESGDETSECESNDAVKEFMNVVCGQFVTAVYGTQDMFNLTIPETLDLPTAPVFEELEEASEDTAILSVDGQWMRLVHTRTA